MSAPLTFTSMEDELHYLRTEQARSKFLLKAIAAQDFEGVINAAKDGRFEPIDVSDYLTVNNTRTSAVYGNCTSVKETPTPGADIPLSEFKRGHLQGTRFMPCVKTVTYSQDSLTNFITNRVFDGDAARAEIVVSEIQSDLELIRGGVAYTCNSRNNRTINECSETHPIFVRFTESVLKRLGRDDVVDSASFAITLNASTLRDGKEVPWTVIGASDIAVYDKSSKDAKDTTLVCELKPPMKQLYRSLAYKQKDQLIGQTMGLAQMLPKRKVIKTILSDMFSINVCIHHKGIFYLSTRVVEARIFVLHFLLALSQSSQAHYAALIEVNDKTVKVEPVYGDDDDCVEPTPSSTQGYNLRSRASSIGNSKTETSKCAGKRKRQLRDFDSDEYYDERRTFEKWYADTHGLVYLQESALAAFAH